MLLTIGQSFRHFPTSHWLWTGEPGQYGSWHNFRILDRKRKFFSTKFPVNGTSLYSLFCSISVHRMTHIYDSWRVTRWWRGNPTLSYTSSIKFKFRSCSRTRINSDRSNNQSASILIFICFSKLNITFLLEIWYPTVKIIINNERSQFHILSRIAWLANNWSWFKTVKYLFKVITSSGSFGVTQKVI